MIAQFTYRGSIGATAPSGWTLVRSDNYPSPVAESSGANEFTTSAIAPSVTAADDNTPLLSFAGALNGSVCWTPPTGMTQHWTFATATAFNVRRVCGSARPERDTRASPVSFANHPPQPEESSRSRLGTLVARQRYAALLPKVRNGP
jgi:hypothetical protein